MGNYDLKGVTLYSRARTGFFPLLGRSTEKKGGEVGDGP